MDKQDYEKMKLVEETLTKAEIDFNEIGIDSPSAYDLQNGKNNYLEVYVRFNR